ncbi:MAG: HD domain-containing phosphohydrolase [Candidatus Acidiferrales bacterium]
MKRGRWKLSEQGPRTELPVETAVGGAEGLAALAENGPFAVVVSDMRMPGMDGIQFLKKAREVSPDTVRLMLTGNADIGTATEAVNEGNVFRFLNKPCPKDPLLKAIEAGIHQYRLVTAEKELLEKTLSGAIQVLTEVLSLVNPAAFSCSVRMRRYVQHIVAHLGLRDAWRFEAAAMMSQLGCVTLHPDTVDAVYAGHKLSPEEQARYNEHPLVARDLLSKIPRLEPIAWMITHQNDCLQIDLAEQDLSRVDIVSLGSQMLKTSLAFDQLLTKGLSVNEGWQELRKHPQEYAPILVSALKTLPALTEAMELKTCAINELRIGMVLQEEVRTVNGMLVVAKGQEITPSLMTRLQNFWEKKSIGNNLLVMKRKTGAKTEPSQQPAPALRR